MERLELFGGVKKAYDFRSKTVHGAGVRGKHQKSVQAAAVLCDDIARRVFRRIIEDKALRDRFGSQRAEAKMDDYFTRLVLTQERCATPNFFLVAAFRGENKGPILVAGG